MMIARIFNNLKDRLKNARRQRACGWALMELHEGTITVEELKRYMQESEDFGDADEFDEGIKEAISLFERTPKK